MRTAHTKEQRIQKQFFNTLHMWWGDDLTNFPFEPLVKFDPTISVRHFFRLRSTKLLLKLWTKAKESARDEGKSPLLVTKVEGAWFCISPLSMSMSDCGSVLTRRLGGDSVEIQSIDDFMLSFEDANPSLFKTKPKLVVKTRAKKTA